MTNHQINIASSNGAVLQHTIDSGSGVLLKVGRHLPCALRCARRAA